MKKHNFSAGPSILANEVFEKASQSVKELNNSGLSLIEISHRSKDFVKIMDEARQLSLELLNLNSDDYTSLFLQGGASTQFLMIAYNFLKNKAGYINTGTWSVKAMKEAKLFGSVDEIASSQDKNFNYIPKNYKIDGSLDYLHITSNNTIFGTQFHSVPVTDSDLFADMSSDIFCRNIDYSKFSLIYAGAQKNLGIAGVTILIIKRNLLSRVNKGLLPILDYSKHADDASMLNTSPVFAWYVSGLIFDWIKDQGGVETMAELNQEKSRLLYNFIDQSSFYSNPVSRSYRSWMNIPFILSRKDLDDEFIKSAEDSGLLNLKGHRTVGGMRASVYNAMPIEGVKKLISFMDEFAKLHE